MNSFEKTLCVQCKIYYGSEERQGMCSVCFKEFKNKDKEKEKEKTAEILSTESTPTTQTPVITSTAIIEIKTQEISSRPVQTNPNNCWKCNKKVGYLGFKCKCEYFFCGTHRHFTDHNCDFDYKSYDREKLKKRNNLDASMNDSKAVK